VSLHILKGRIQEIKILTKLLRNYLDVSDIVGLSKHAFGKEAFFSIELKLKLLSFFSVILCFVLCSVMDTITPSRLSLFFL
jgi:hypothetical protein